MTITACWPTGFVQDFGFTSKREDPATGHCHLQGADLFLLVHLQPAPLREIRLRAPSPAQPSSKPIVTTHHAAPAPATPELARSRSTAVLGQEQGEPATKPPVS